jgi:hypothetical protein
MAVARSVRTFHLAQLASVAKVDDFPGLLPGETADIAAAAIDRAEESRKRRTQVEAQSAAVADVVNALEFLVESGAVPVHGLGRAVGKAVGRFGFDSMRGH